MTDLLRNEKERTIPFFDKDPERISYLNSRGYKYHRPGNGGHSYYRHDRVYDSAVARRVKLPKNFLSAQTVDKTPGEIMLSTGCGAGTWEKIIKQINWAAEEYVANDPTALQAEREELRSIMKDLRSSLREARDERRSLNQLQRSLCQEFKRVGMKGALRYLEQMGPALDKTKARLNAAHMAVETLRERAGTVEDRARGMAAPTR